MGGIGYAEVLEVWEECMVCEIQRVPNALVYDMQ